jgi:hypothetical protein
VDKFKREIAGYEREGAELEAGGLVDAAARQREMMALRKRFFEIGRPDLLSAGFASKRRYYEMLEAKCVRAARYPWLPVPVDPPEPE